MAMLACPCSVLSKMKPVRVVATTHHNHKSTYMLANHYSRSSISYHKLLDIKNSAKCVNVYHFCQTGNHNGLLDYASNSNWQEPTMVMSRLFVNVIQHSAWLSHMHSDIPHSHVVWRFSIHRVPKLVTALASNMLNAVWSNRAGLCGSWRQD